MKMRENPEEKGEKQISYEQKSMSECAAKLSSKLDIEADIEAHILVVIEQALTESGNVASYANKQLDELSRNE